MKKAIVIILIFVMSMSFAACTDKSTTVDEDMAVFTVCNNIDNQIYAIGISCLESVNAACSAAVRGADGKPLSNNSEFDFRLRKSDLPEDADLRCFGLKFYVDDSGGYDKEVATAYFPLEYGKNYYFNISGGAEKYTVSSNDAVTILLNDEDNTAQTEDDNVIKTDALTGPWHLDENMNDLKAFEMLFPGYAEWGSGMEIRSNGMMSWYIGAEGGNGSYQFDGKSLALEYVSTLSDTKASVSMSAKIINDILTLEMPYGDINIIWIYGDNGEIPAYGTEK